MSALKAIFARFTPMVVPENWTAPVLLEVMVAGTPTAVKLWLQSTGGEIALWDDGSGGDKIAGDSIYTVTLAAADVLYNYTPDDVNRHLIGYLRLYDGGQVAEHTNIFADILTANIPPVQVTPVSLDVQYTEHLVNIVDPGFFPSLDVSHATSKFYSYLADDYDFLNVISELSFFQNRHFEGVRDHAQGIGTQPFDNGTTYGSGRRLLGCVRFPDPTWFDGASTGNQHELGHQWINFLSVPPLDRAIPHWPLSDLASDIMGWGDGTDPEGLEFNFDLVPVGNDFDLVPNNGPKAFSDLSLYLMGLLPASQVGPHFVFDDQTQTAAGGRLHGPVTYITAADILNSLGPRIPDSDHAQTKFRVGTMIVSKESLLCEDAMRLYEFFAARAEATQVLPYSEGLVKGQTKPFYLATHGLGRLDARIKRRILVDASRDGGVWWFPQAGPFDAGTAHQGYALASYLRALGHMVTELPRPYPITASLLADYDIVIRASGFGTYDPTEIAAYLDYVQQGGKLLLLAEYGPPDDLALSLGVEFAGVTRGQNLLVNYVAHPITNGVGPVFYAVGGALLAVPATAQVVGWLSGQSYLDLNNNAIHDPGEPSAPPVLGIMNYGQGRIVFCGDTNLWEAVPQLLVDNTLRWFEDPHQIQEATLYEGMKAYMCNSSCWRFDGKVASTGFFTNIHANNAEIAGLLADLVTPLAPTTDDTEVWERTRAVWAWLQTHGLRSTDADYAAVESYYTALGDWPSIAEYAHMFVTWGGFLWEDCTCMCRAHALATLLCRVGVPVDRMAIAETRWKAAYSQHMYIVLKLGCHWYYVDPSTNAPSLGLAPQNLGEGSADYVHPNSLILLPGSTLMKPMLVR